MTIETVERNAKGEVSGSRRPLNEGEFKRTRRLSDVQPRQGVGVRVLSPDTVEYFYIDTNGNPASILLKDCEINGSNFFQPGKTPGTYETIVYTPDNPETEDEG